MNPPEHWQEFEKLCADLWGRIWNDPNTQMHGRSGQAQHGVDVYGRKGGDGDWAGVQCKGIDGRYGAAVTKTELKAEVEKAKKFKPPIKEFILATTAKNDATIQRVARKITQEHEKEGLFSVVVFGWSEIHRRLANYRDLIDKYYPGQGRGLNRVEEGVKTLLEQQFVAEERQDKQMRDVATEAAKGTVAELGALLVSAGMLSDSSDASPSPVDNAVNSEIDGYRDLLLKNQPRTTLKLLEQLKERQWEKTSNWIKFRILTNIASAHLALGDKETASKGFLEAKPYAPQNEKAACNVAMAHLIVENDADARDAARNAIEAHPESDRAYGLLVAASITDDGVEKPEDLVPAERLETNQVAFAVSHFYRTRGMSEEAAEWMTKAYNLDSDPIEVRNGYATTLLQGVFKDQSATFGEQRDGSQEEALNTAAEVLSEIWDDVKDTETAAQHLEIVINLTTAERLRGNFEKALEVVDGALRLSPDSFELKRQKAVICLETDDPCGACEVLATVPEEKSLGVSLLFADALAQAGKSKEALSQLERYLREGDDEKQLTVAAGSRLRLVKIAEGSKAAIEAVEDAVANQPEAIFVRVNAATVLQECGDEDAARKQVQAAKKLIDSDTEYGEKLLIADAAFHLEDYEEAIVLYRELVKTYGNSQPLRRLLICLFESDKRKEVLDLLKKIPRAVRELRFFKRMAAGIYVRIGDFDAARKEIDAYLALEPDDLNVRFNWIDILLRQGEREAVETFLSKVTDYPDAAPEYRIYLAQLLDYFGHPDKALDLGYRVLKENPRNAKVHLGYMGLLLIGNAGTGLKEPSEITVGTAFFVEDAKANRSVFFISDDATAELREGEIPPDHPIAVSALGKKVGETVKVEKNPYQKDERRIVEIKSKYLHALHVSMAEFSTRFPTDHSFMTVSVANPDGDGFCFDALFQSLGDRRDYVLETLEKYRSEPYPIGVMAKLLGTHPIDVWRGFQADPEIRVFCCDGTAPERRQAKDLINSNKQGFVVDPLTLYNMFKLGVCEPVTATIGKLGITQSGLDLFQSLIDNHRLHGGRTGYSQMWKQGDQYVRHEVTKEDIEADIRQLEEICDWASKNCEILPAVGREETPALAREFAELMHPALTDCILAANGKGGLLLTDDQRLRLYSKQLWKVDGVWLQTVLMEALKRNLMTLERYSDVATSLIEAGIYFTTIDHRVLLQIAKSEGWEATNRFKTVVATIGGKKADLRSSLGVAAGFLNALWHRSLPLRQRENLTFALINTITENQGFATTSLLDALILIGDQFSKLERSIYLSAIQSWCTGHFIPMPNPGH